MTHRHHEKSHRHREMTRHEEPRTLAVSCRPSRGSSHTNTNARRDRNKSGNSSDNRWGSSLGNSCCRIRYRIRYRNNSGVEAAEVLAGDSRRRASAEDLRGPVLDIAELVADAPDVQSSQAIPVPLV